MSMQAYTQTQDCAHTRICKHIGWSLNVTCASLVNINPQGNQNLPVFFMCLCVLFLLSWVLCYHGLVLCLVRAEGTYTHMQFPHNHALSRMSAQVRVVVGSVKVCVCGASK